MPGTGHETDTMSQSFMGYRLPHHQGDLPPSEVFSPPTTNKEIN